MDTFLSKALLACSLAAFIGCSHPDALFSPKQGLCLDLPALPPSWSSLPQPRLLLEWRDGDGRARKEFYPFGSRVGVEVPRGRPQSIMATPYAGDRAFFPAGTRYPTAMSSPFPGECQAGPGRGHGGRGDICLGWRGGWLAALCLELERAGLLPESFNLERLAMELFRRRNDPWFLAPSVAARKLADGSFRVGLLEEPELFPARLPSPGPWLAPSALAPSPLEGSGIVHLPEGMSLFWGAESDLVVFVDEGGQCLQVTRPR